MQVLQNSQLLKGGIRMSDADPLVRQEHGFACAPRVAAKGSDIRIIAVCPQPLIWHGWVRNRVGASRVEYMTHFGTPAMHELLPSTSLLRGATLMASGVESLRLNLPVAWKSE